jgi:prepilin-type N-terminal cleavage/methylation domain-containing protein
MKRLAHQQSGFTIVELMIATMVFSTVLLLCAVGLISVGRMYQKGNTSRATQEVSRNIMDQITNDFELSGGQYIRLANSGNVQGFCIGNNMYSYEDYAVGAFRVNQVAGCGSAVTEPSLSLGKEMLGPNMQIGDLDITPEAGDPAPAINIRLNIVAGDLDLLRDARTPQVRCKGGPGQEYCASSVLETYATRRLQ